MHESIAQLANHVVRTVDGPMWHGPALLGVLDGVSAEIAAARPIRGAHSIWELMMHVGVWAEIAGARIEGRTVATPTPAEDFPSATDTSDEAWRAAVARLRESYRTLATTVMTLADADLERTVPTSDGTCSVLELLHGVIEHGTYHGGQIALLKRAGAAGASAS